MRILIIEDEPRVAAALRDGLQQESFSVSVALTGEDGFFQLNSNPFDLVILDLLLPGRDGLQVLQALRKSGSKIPVLILTARDTVEDRVQGLNAGADDYLVKPFAFAELTARIRALLRRAQDESVLSLECEGLHMDLIARTVHRANRPIDLTVREFEILEYLLRRQGHVVSRDMLARDVWRETARHTPLDNVIDVHMARLRRKIDDPFPSRLLHTVRGVGFTLKRDLP